MKTMRAILFLIIFFSSQFLYAEASNVNVGVNKPTLNTTDSDNNYFKVFSGTEKLVLGKDDSGAEIKISMKIMPFPTGYPKQVPKYPYFGFRGVGEYSQPAYSLSEVKVWHDKRLIGIPVSAYLDLTEIHNISLNVRNDDFFIITIGGGDASNSYNARFIFKNNKLIKR